MIQSPNDIPCCTVNIITEKPIFPNIYWEGSYFNVTINVTNRELETSEQFDLGVILSQSISYPRVENDYSGGISEIQLEPGESYKYNFSCKPYVMSNWHFGIFEFDVWVYHDSVIIKHKIKFLIVLY